MASAKVPADNVTRAPEWPQIVVADRHLRELSAECLDVLRNSNEPSPHLFVRGGAIVQIVNDENGRSTIKDASETFLAGCLTRNADFGYHHKLKDGESVFVPKHPPRAAIHDILSRAQTDWRLPPLVTVTQSPLLRPDGSIALEPGYDRVLRSVYIRSPALTVPNIPLHPDKGELEAAVALLRECIGDFPFVDPASQANVFGMLLTPLIRELVDGNVPIALLDAPQQGTGKSLLAEVVSVIHTGSNAAMKSPPKDDEEWRKNLTSVLQAGHSITIFDNLSKPLWSPSLALAVTCSVWEDRVLGRTQLVRLPQRTTFIVTGNNIQLRGDLPRRCYWVRLDAESSRPWTGRKFKHPALLDWTRKHRGELVGALLTMASGWYAAGRPPSDGPILGSFEGWCRIVGGILAYSSVGGFLGNLKQMHDDADPSQAQWALFLQKLRAFSGGKPFTIRDLLPLMVAGSDITNSLPEEFVEADKDRSRSLGRAFQRNRGRRFGNENLHIEMEGTAQGGVKRWKVEKG
jgi:hypothetical protein